jgi:hypothetical protein
MKFSQEVDWDIWRNFHVNNIVWITIGFEWKFKYSSEFELELNLNGTQMEFDLI